MEIETIKEPNLEGKEMSHIQHKEEDIIEVRKE
jgi:hypothetical protein